MKRLVLVIILSILSFSSVGQTVLKATSQGWAGGVCCVSGTNYSVVFELSKSIKKFEVDSVYVKAYGWAPITLHSEYSVDNKRRINVSFESRRNEYDPYLYDRAVLIPFIRNFEGEALIILKVNGKRVDKTISSFEELMFLAYP